MKDFSKLQYGKKRGKEQDSVLCTEAGLFKNVDIEIMLIWNLQTASWW